MKSFRILYSLLVLSVLIGACQGPLGDDTDTPVQLANKPERLHWFRELSLGMFIHWGFDSQLGTVISHSMVGATDGYNERFIRLADTFDPDDFQPQRWAELARLAGMRYVVFGAKHHSGFCMFKTRTTDFGVMHTPFGRDVAREVVQAFRREGLAIGFYFSPDDFYFLHQRGIPISRSHPEVLPKNNPELMAYDKAQLTELLTQYGDIDLLFLDGEPNELNPGELQELAWRLQPNIVITRGAMVTPEERLPGQALADPWEACYPIGTQWQFKPTNETYKTGKDIIKMLVETRATGGNLLLNVGPTPYGQIPFEQERRLRELATWNLINGEAVFGSVPWEVTHEGDVWYTQAKDGSVVYACLTDPVWPWGERREITLKNVHATAQTQVSILGETGRVLEYQPEVDPRPMWRQTTEGLHISAMRTKRVYDDCDWPNPIVFALTQVQPGNPGK